MNPSDFVCHCADCEPRAGEPASWQVVSTCVESPCPTCRAQNVADAFQRPVMHGKHYTQPAARADANKCQKSSGRDGRHRYDVAALREDGWQMCAWCEQDELYSMSEPTSLKSLAGCYRCGTTFKESVREPVIPEIDEAPRPLLQDRAAAVLRNVDMQIARDELYGKSETARRIELGQRALKEACAIRARETGIRAPRDSVDMLLEAVCRLYEILEKPGDDT